jgi:hypothetical protein
VTPTEARQLAVKLKETWHGGPSVDVWVEELEPLHAGTAGTTLVRLRREEDRAPSIAKFLALYRSLHTQETEKPYCPVCDSTGWIEGPDLIKGDPDNGGARYTQVIPCIACEYGAQARRIHPKILEHNARPT